MISRGRGRSNNQGRFALIKQSQLPGGDQVVPLNWREDRSQENSGTTLRRRKDSQIESRSLKGDERQQQYNEVVQSGGKQLRFSHLSVLCLPMLFFIEVVVVFCFQIHFN